MTITQHAVRRFVAPSLSGRAALLVCILSLAIPTLIRASIGGLETSVSFTAYTPFVVLAAIFLAWQYAAVIAVGAAALADLLFVGPPLEILERRSDVFGVLTFLAACGVTIFIAQLSRRAVDSHTRLKASQHSGVIFSLEDGQAWATWYGHETPVCLGPKEEVVEMMRDFIAQVELGEHFDKRSQH